MKILRPREIDNAITMKVQDAYLWLFDRTGIYIAILMMISMVLSYMFMALRRPLDTVDMIFLGLNGLVIFPYYIDQANKKYEVFNFRARSLGESTFRFVFCVFFALLGITSIVSDWKYAVELFMIVVYFYLLTVQIREREPKDFFKVPESKLAHAKI